MSKGNEIFWTKIWALKGLSVSSVKEKLWLLKWEVIQSFDPVSDPDEQAYLKVIGFEVQPLATH